MHSSSYTFTPRIALAILVLAATGCSPRVASQSETPRASNPTPMPLSGSAVLLEADSICRAQPEDSAASITTVQAGTKLPIVAQHERWFLVELELFAGFYARCWLQPGASSVTGMVADIPAVANPKDVSLLPAQQPGIIAPPTGKPYILQE